MNNKRIKSIVIIFVVDIFSICSYEVYISYNNLTFTNYTINSNKVNDNINVTIISDLHENRFGEDNTDLIKKIEKQSPDIILVAGDMTNEDSTDIKLVTTLRTCLSEIAPVFYSLGNTEYDNITKFNSDIIKQLENINVTVLDKEYEDIKIKNTIIRIGGMYDYAFALNGNNTYKFLCDFQDTESYKIMMAHRPDSFIFGDASEVWDIDLVVSGHTHGGQVRLPFMGGL